MSRSSEPGERAQHSVAELLARYGEAAPSTGRRRRRAPEDNNTAPQSIIERVRTDSAPLPAVDHRGHRRPDEPELDDRGPFHADLHDDGPGPASFDSRGWTDLTGLTDSNGQTDFNGPDFTARTDRNGTGFHAPNPTDFYAPTDRNGTDFTAPTDRNGSRWGEFDGRGPGPAAFDARGVNDRDGYGLGAYRPGADANEDTWMGLPPVGAGPEPLNGRVLSGGPITDQLPRVEPVAPEPSAFPEPVAQVPAPPTDYRPRSGEPAAGLGTSTQAIPRPGHSDRRAGQDAGPAPDGLDDDEQLYHDDQGMEFLDEVGAEEATSPVREWVVMATQIGVGVVGGAVLWLICEWLWQRIPVLALVVALAVITGLVWVVRRVRRAEDLQTTVIAVLVGLFVTVSPAALLLVGR
ncbi:MAG: hypothetical protein ACRDRM_10920 [Pseudonocardiaceae bacterium]